MKVGYLINQLQKFDPEADVKLHTYDGYPAIFVLARANDPKQVWLETEEDCDMKHQLEEFFKAHSKADKATRCRLLLELGITFETAEKYLGDKAHQLLGDCL